MESTPWTSNTAPDEGTFHLAQMVYGKINRVGNNLFVDKELQLVDLKTGQRTGQRLIKIKGPGKRFQCHEVTEYNGYRTHIMLVDPQGYVVMYAQYSYDAYDTFKNTKVHRVSESEYLIDFDKQMLLLYNIETKDLFKMNPPGTGYKVVANRDFIYTYTQENGKTITRKYMNI